MRSLFWKTIKRTLIAGAALLAVLILVLAAWNWLSGRRVEARLAELRKQGMPVSLRDLARPEVSPEDNAATYFNRAHQPALALEAELTPIMTEVNERGGELTDAEAQQLDEAFATYPRVIPLLLQAVECATYRPDVDYQQPPSRFLEQELDGVQTARSYARVLMMHQKLRTHQGRPDEALQSGVALLKLARLLEQDPLIVEYLVATAVRSIGLSEIGETISLHDLSTESHQLLERELATDADLSGLRKAIISDRAFGISSIHELRSNGISRLLLYPELAGYLDYMEYAVSTADQSAFQSTDTPTTVMVGMFARLMVPAVNAARTARSRSLAQLRALRVLNAIQATESLRSAEEVDLAALTLPLDATIDPFTGQPLIVRKSENGWFVYSVGQNLRDDGGEVAKLEDVGFAPREAGSIELNPEATQPPVEPDQERPAPDELRDENPGI